jgi:23S rRNA pseudouridine955/2504/2580 synthase
MNKDKKDQIICKYTVVIDAAHDGQRIDNYLMSQYKGVPKARLYRALRKGEVRINKKRSKQTDRIHKGDAVRLPPLKTRKQVQPLPKHVEKDLHWLKSAILFEDEGLLVIDKPAGLAVHGGTGVGISLLPLLKALYPDQYLRLVHRIDRATSGCLLIAKSRAVLLDLQNQFREHSIEKSYQALCFGQMSVEQLPRSSYLTKVRDGESGVKMFEAHAGQLAESVLYKDQVGECVSNLSVKITTGRMHQIRVHCAAVGLPILGDIKYGDAKANAMLASHGVKRMFLHAHQITIDYDNQPRQFIAPLPEAFLQLPVYDAWLSELAENQ